MTPDHGAGPRRRQAAVAGHEGDAGTARHLLGDDDPSVRATALGALARIGALSAAEVELSLRDSDPGVRRRACEVAVGVPDVDLRSLLADVEASVVEAAAWAIGERGAVASDAVDDLVGVARQHDEALCREAAVAALGAIGDRRGLAAVLAAAASDRPAVRRRAVVALAAFDGPDVDAALRAALGDRDWQVRQAAEDLLPDPGPSDPRP
jgi:HEAT repeat protein